jgi:hypothetical protein
LPVLVRTKQLSVHCVLDHPDTNMSGMPLSLHA